MINESHWQYFLSLEQEVIKISPFIWVNRDNFGTYSIELLKIYLSICSEVDVVARLLCKKIDLNKYNCMTNNDRERKNINTYRQIICEHYPEIYRVKVRSSLYKFSIYPWKKFLRSESPSWWKNYNNVKHSREQFLKQANLRNVLYSLSGLLVLLMYFCHPGTYISLDELSVPKLIMIQGDNYHGGVSWEGPRLYLPNQ